MNKFKNQKIIVIGGGMAGMIAACTLQKYGQRSLVLEQSHHTGGNMSGFKRGQYSFDGGAQSFESLGIVFPILQDLGIYDKIKWTKVRYRFVSRDFDFFVDSFKTVEVALLEAFPNEPGIKEIFKEVRKVSAFLSHHCSAQAFPLLNDYTPHKLFHLLPSVPSLRKWLTFEYREKVCSVIKDPALRSWFTGIGYYRMPFIFFAGFWELWMSDYWYPEGGMQHLHDVIADRYKSLGGELQCNRTVVKIEVNNRKATGVWLHNGEFMPADRIIYAGDYMNLVSGLLDESQFPAKKVKSLKGTKLTESLFTVFLGLKISPEKLKSALKANHTFCFPNYDVIFPGADSPEDIHERMWVVANFFMDENPSSAPSGQSNLVLQTYSSMEWRNFWGNKGDAYPRSKQYQKIKKEVGLQMVRLAENLVPGISKKIAFFDAGTPLTIKRFSMNDQGSSGGWCYDDRISPVFRSPFKNLMSTPVRNVHAAGHYTVWPGGVISAALSGRIVANIATGQPALAPLRK